VLETVRRDSTVVVVTLGYASRLVPLPGRTFNDVQRLRTIDEVMRRLRPDILIPAQDPYRRRNARGGAHAGVLGELLTRAAEIAKRVRPRTKIAWRRRRTTGATALYTRGPRDADHRSTWWASRSSPRRVA